LQGQESLGTGTVSRVPAAGMFQLRLMWRLAEKDLKVAYRSKQTFSTTLFFAVLILTTFVFAFDPGSRAIREATPGILWVALIFPGLIQLNRSFQVEMDEDTLQGLVLSPADRGVIFLGKVIASWIFLLIVDLLVLAVFLVGFNFSLSQGVLWVVLLIGLAGAGFSGVGTLFAAMVSGVRTREVLFPILLLPVIVPIIIAAVNATQEVLVLEEIRFLSSWIELLVVFDVITLAGGFWLFEYVVADR